MCIGSSISLLISTITILIWRDRKPHRPTFYLICILVAPVGYYLGGSMALFIYNRNIPSVMSLLNSGNRASVIMTIFISLFAGAFFWNRSRISELQAEQEREKARTAAIERQAMQAQLQLLQAQIEPHMLFNTLANLQGLIAIDPDRAQHMLTQFIHYLRASLNSSRVEKTTLKHEFELMNAYLELLAIRMGKRLRYSSDLPSALEKLEIAPMLIQPLVENAIKHGIEPKIEGGCIHVSAELLDSVLHVKVSDTGLGLPLDYDESQASQSSQESHSHVGNANVRDRILALYGSNSSLRLIPNTPCGVIAHLTLSIDKI